MATCRTIVHNLETAFAFYQSLGFTLSEQFGPAMAIMARNDLTLWRAVPLASASKPMPVGAQPAPGGWNRIVLTVADLAATVADLRAKGGSFRNAILCGPGGSQILLNDRSGSMIELFQPR